MKTLRLALLVAACALSPAVASAQAFGWLDWLENLEGPGDWWGFGVGLHGPTIGRTGPFLQEENVPDHLLELRGAWIWTTDRQGYKRSADDDALVQLVQFQPLYRFRTPWRAFDVGAGAGFLTMWGDGIDPVTKPTASVNASFVIPQLFRPRRDRTQDLRWFKFEVEPVYVFKGFTGEEFGNPAAPPLDAEWVWSLGFVVDFFNLREALR
jgi:hypothetical protein